MYLLLPTWKSSHNSSVVARPKSLPGQSLRDNSVLEKNVLGFDVAVVYGFGMNVGNGIAYLGKELLSSLWTRCAGMGRSDEHLAAGVAWPPGVFIKEIPEYRVSRDKVGGMSTLDAVDVCY
jgi:hypothetical protein